MACGCSKGSSAKREYIYTDSRGKQTTYPSQIAAQAAQVRAKGAGSVRPKQ